MGYKNFRFSLIIRVLLLALSIFLLFYFLNLNKYLISISILSLLIIYQLISLINFVETGNRKLRKFLESIRYSDFTSSFSGEGMGKSFDELNKEFNQVIQEFKKNRAEKEEHFNYLQTVVQHVSIGIIAYSRKGKVDICNTALKKIFGVNHIRSIQELKHVKKDLPDILLGMKAGDKTLLKLFAEGELLQLSMYATEFRMRSQNYVLVSVQDIHNELEEKEIESWQKLIRVLTHEIMNSITPISSLASTVQELLFDENTIPVQLKKIDLEELSGIENALRTIQRRSQGLINFVEIYRNLTRIPKPNFRHFEVNGLFERAKDLMRTKTEKLNIVLEESISPENLKITADPDLLDQVVINLLLNAIDALQDTENPRIKISAFINNSQRTAIEVSDNGHGIKPDIMDKIFMPFFTSKKTGSGIGLSLSRQIMSLHKGSISVKSKPGHGSVFTLTF